MARAYKCDICGEFAEGDAPMCLRITMTGATPPDGLLRKDGAVYCEKLVCFPCGEKAAGNK